MGARAPARADPRACPAHLHRLLPEPGAHEGALARHRRGQPHLPRRLRRDGLARAGRALRHRRLRDGEPRRGRRRLADRPEPMGRDAARNPRRGRRGALLRRDLEPQLRDLLPHDHPGHRGPDLLLLRPGDAAFRLRRRQQRRPPGRRLEPGHRPAEPLLHRAPDVGRRSTCSFATWCARHLGLRCRASGTTPRACARSGTTFRC